jgi:hypothetical protein
VGLWKVLDRVVLVATLAVAVTALVWAHIDSSQQAAVLDQSRAALSGVLTSVRAEGATLNSVSDKLTRSNGALDKLQQHAAATVEDLNRADAALRDVLATSRSLSAVDREIFSTSERQLRLLASEHAEEVARENAAPKISVQLMYDRGDAPPFYWNAPRRPWGNRVILPPQGGEQNLSWGLVLTNTGDAVAQDVIVLIRLSGDLYIGGLCQQILPKTFQCPSPDIERRGAGLVRFSIPAPKTADTYIITVTVLTRKANGTRAPFSAEFPVYLRPPVTSH